MADLADAGRSVVVRFMSMTMTITITMLLLLLLLLSTVATPPARGEVALQPMPAAVGSFYRSVLNPGDIIEQTVLPIGNVDSEQGAAADLVVVGIFKNKTRQIRLYRHIDGRFADTAAAIHPLPEDVIFVDSGTWQGKRQLIVFSANEARQFDPVSGKQLKLIEFDSIYNSPIKDELPKFDVMRDLNGDGLDDFIVPGFQGFSVFMQQADASFSEPAKLQAPAVMEVSYGRQPWYTVRNTYQADLTNDGVEDLVFWLDSGFAVYPQTDAGISSTPLMLFPPVSFEAEGYEGVSMRMGEDDQSNAEKKALFDFRDLTGDGLPELVTLVVRSEGVFKKTSTYAVHLGRQDAQGRFFLEGEASSLIESGGIQFDFKTVDVNNDRQQDIVVSSVELGLGKIVSALLTGSVNIDLNVFAMGPGGYPSEPDTVRKIKASFDLSSGEVFFPAVKLADVSGDGVRDLLVQKGTDTLLIYLGDGSKALFSRSAIEVTVAMSGRPELLEVVDLNGDARQDLIIRREPVGAPFQVIVMIAR